MFQLRSLTLATLISTIGLAAHADGGMKLDSSEMKVTVMDQSASTACKKSDRRDLLQRNYTVQECVTIIPVQVKINSPELRLTDAVYDANYSVNTEVDVADFEANGGEEHVQAEALTGLETLLVNLNSGCLGKVTIVTFSGDSVDFAPVHKFLGALNCHAQPLLKALREKSSDLSNQAVKLYSQTEQQGEDLARKANEMRVNSLNKAAEALKNMAH